MITTVFLIGPMMVDDLNIREYAEKSFMLGDYENIAVVTPEKVIPELESTEFNSKQFRKARVKLMCDADVVITFGDWFNDPLASTDVDIARRMEIPVMSFEVARKNLLTCGALM